MAPQDDRAEAFFADATRWRDELAALRALLLAAELDETFKWRGPCYMAHGGNIVMLGALKDGCSLGFFKGALLSDPDGVLAPPGPNSRAARVARLSSLAEIEAQAPALRACIAEAMALEAAGARVAPPPDDLPPPAELVAAFDADPGLKAAFARLTPGRRRGWILHFGQPKGTAARARRVAKAAPAILAGKGMHDR